MRKKVILAAKDSVIEPLGLLHLASIAKKENFEPIVTLVKNSDFSDLDSLLEKLNPEFLGFTVYTGNHVPTFRYLDKLKQKNNKIKIIVGGPHPTFFPNESVKHADYVVLSEGFGGFRKILNGKVNKGIVHLTDREKFSLSEREQFYRDNLHHANSPIKSIITQTGCPYRCTYCYNSCTLETIIDSLTNQQQEEMSNALGSVKNLFPKSQRSVDDVVDEVNEIKRISPQTQMIYFQDDVFATNLNWAKEFAEKYSRTGLPFHAQMRFEYADPKNPKCRERIELMREAGCTGLTFAIESASHIIRREVLNRNMKEELMFEVLNYLNKLEYKVRTEQMLGLPCGATTQPTKINLEADLETLELNVKLTEQTGLPNLAWASIFAPYRGTEIGKYCSKHGFYSGGNNDVPETFFERSILRFPKKWVGPKLSPDEDYWLSEDKQKEYRDKMQLLRDLFNFFALIPKGHKLAKTFLDQKDKSFFGLSTTTRRHLYDSVLYNLK